MSEYQPIPVSAARGIATRYAKSIVLIFAYDPSHESLHTVTYGREPDDKVHAAYMGDQCTKFIGGDLLRRTTYADFRTADAAERAAAVERLPENYVRFQSQCPARSIFAAVGTRVYPFHLDTKQED